jgi:hypothetical protein
MAILAMIAGGIAALSFFLTPIGVGILGLLGFSAAGPVAGKFYLDCWLCQPSHLKSPSTVAAGLQATYGSAVAAGSVFAFLQSLTMGGAVLASVNAFATGVGLVATGVAAVLGILGL